MRSSVGDVMRKVCEWMLPMSVLFTKTEVNVTVDIHSMMINIIRRLFVTMVLYLNGIAVAITLSTVMIISASHDTKMQWDAMAPNTYASSLSKTWLTNKMPDNAVMAFKESEMLRFDNKTFCVSLMFRISCKSFNPTTLRARVNDVAITL